MDRMGYQSLTSNHNDGTDGSIVEDVMVHVVPETNKTRWNHIEDLDSFFTRAYNYHQRHGFLCILCIQCFALMQYLFVIVFGAFLVQCVDYPVLFKEKNTTAIGEPVDPLGKIALYDAIIPPGQCVSHFGVLMWVTLIVAAIFWFLRIVHVVFNTMSNLETRAFYRTALHIHDCELDNMTWQDVQKKIMDVQRDQQMCIHKQELTELDIYNRILRFKNYLIAMINKGLFPIKHYFPFAGDVVFLTHGLKYNLEMILFWGPYAPFENSWHLNKDYKKLSKKRELAHAISKRILFVGIANLILSPLIFLWQILYSFFNYAELVKREPGALGMRRWSLYGRYYLRHFNELDHEFNARLARAYRPAAKYMGIFNTPLLAIIAQNVAFVAGAMFAVLSALTIYDEDVLSVEHVLLVLTVCGAVIAVCRAFIPDEHAVFCPERLMTAVLIHAHYSQDHWRGKAHTTTVRDEFALLFQYKVMYLLEELVSPFVTPLILIFYVRPKAQEIVDFFRNFTVEVIGVGDICSFAQMDVRKHGNPAWQSSMYDMDGSDHHPAPSSNSYSQAENGKTELSLVHFTHTNPEWKPPTDSGQYIANIKERAARDAANLATVVEENPLLASLNSISGMEDVVAGLIREHQLLNGSMYNADMLNSQIHANNQSLYPNTNLGQQSHLFISPQASFRGYLNRHEGPLHPSQRGVSSVIHQSGLLPSYSNAVSFANSFAQYPAPPLSRVGNSEFGTFEGHALDMSMDALYLHECHHQELRRRSTRSNVGGGTQCQSQGPVPSNQQQFSPIQPQLHVNLIAPTSQNQSQNTEKTPLLSNSHFPRS